jgi:hypothetical protein
MEEIAYPVTNSSVNFLPSNEPSFFLSKKAVKPLVRAMRMQKPRAMYEPQIPRGAVYGILSFVIPCALRAFMKKMCVVRMEIQERRPKMVTRLLKYPNTLEESAETFMNARQQNKELRKRALYGTPLIVCQLGLTNLLGLKTYRLSVFVKKCGALP